ncbi:MAG: DUF3109 family protein [Bacteroidetes bacterium]|nr:DUF3109 family protein [Bacteroidota bacterium]
MLIIDDILVSDELIEKKFVCDINACKGACCVKGDSGAPLEKEELKIIDEILPKVMPYLNENGKRAIKKHGAYVIDEDGDYTTTLVSEKAECAFVIFDKNGTAKCAIESAYLDKKIDYKKPISCHLYPIRINKLKTHTALNYDKWDICKPACACGEKLNVPVFKFLKEPIERKFGKNWFKKLEKIAKLYLTHKSQQQHF